MTWADELAAAWQFFLMAYGAGFVVSLALHFIVMVISGAGVLDWLDRS